MAIVNTATVDDTTTAQRSRTSRSRMVAQLSRRERMLLASDLLPPCDFVAVLFAAYVSAMLSTLIVVPPDIALAGPWTHLSIGGGNLALIGAALATYILYDQNFAAAAAQRETAMLVRSYLWRALATIAIVLAIGKAAHFVDSVPGVWLVLWLGTSVTFTGLLRWTVAKRVRLLSVQGVLAESIAVVGAGAIAEEFHRHLRESKGSNVEIVGVFDDGFGDKSAAKRATQSLDQLAELSRARQLDWIVLAIPETEQERLQAAVQRLKDLPVPIALSPQSIGLKAPCSGVDYVGNGMPVFLLADRPIKHWNVMLKAAEDFILGWALVILFAPLMAAIALAIRVTSPGPVIFKQRRHTFNNGEFEIYKFRTMRWRANDGEEKLEQTERNDPRVTAVGRWLRASSLDELPQLFNVVKGQMSLVGPRPHAVNMRTEDRMGSEITDRYAHRHRVKPGMTGWAQVNGARGATHTAAQLRRRVELDLYYIDHWSLWLDCKILCMTWRAVLRRTNAF